MVTPIPGVGGTLFPSRFLADRRVAAASGAPGARAGRWVAWWRDVSSICGPATSVRELFDRIALPIAQRLGMQPGAAEADSRLARATLETPGGTPIGLVVLPWARRPSSAWREVARHAAEIRASWCLLVAPPYVSIVDARGHGLRRSIDFTLPDALDGRTFEMFVALAGADAFEGRPSRLERLVADAERFQDRVRDDLQAGVAASIQALVGAARAGAPRPRKSGHRPSPAIARLDEALTIVYRILFLLFAESRDLVPVHHPIYGPSYTVGAICRDAVSGDTTGLTDALAAITRLARTGCLTDDLIVRPFNGRLFARQSAPAIEQPRRRRRRARADAHDAALGRALVALGSRQGPAGREAIQYADLGVEQLGAVYERVLDLDVGPPPVTTSTRARGTHSARRKATGTFYTPQPLADLVVRRTLAPLVAGATADEILALRVVDPAMGSGAFLVSACRYLAEALEHALIEEGRLTEWDADEPVRADLRRQVAERCLAGVDSNPIAVQLAQLSLWLAALAQGRPLGFLDHRLRCGNSLIGAWPDDLHRVHAARLRSHRDETRPLFEAAGLDDVVRRLEGPIATLSTRRDETVEDVRAKHAIWRQLTASTSPFEPWRQAAALWCAQSFWPSDAAVPAPSAAELRAAVDDLVRGTTVVPADRLRRWTDIATAAARAHGGFHWPVEFPDVFHGRAGDATRPAGFDAVIGNPPWEMLRRDAESSPATEDEADVRSGLRRYLRASGQYRLSGGHHVNLYLPFVERSLALLQPKGRAGLVLPWGFASDDGASALRRQLIERGALESVVGFDNALGLFPIHRGVRFLVAVIGPARPGRPVHARFGLRHAAQIAAVPARDDDAPPEGSGAVGAAATAGVAAPPRAIRLDPDEWRDSGGRTGRIPDVRSHEDLSLLVRMCRSWPRLGGAGGMAIEFGRDLNATDDRASLGSSGMPVLEGKSIAPFVADTTAPRLRIAPREAARLLPDGRFARHRLAYRDVSGVGNRVSLIAAVLPPHVVTTHTLFCLRTPLDLRVQHYLCGVMNSYVLNAVVRLLMGGHLTTSLVEDLPVPRWTASPAQVRIARLAERIGAARLAPDGRRPLPARTRRGPGGPAARDRPARYAGLEARLQARVARLYELDAAAFRRVIDGFPLVPADDRARAMAAFERLAGVTASPRAFAL